MVKYEVNGHVFDIKNHLGVTEEIKRAFNKDYIKLLEQLDKLSIGELIKFIYTTVDNTELGNLKEFTEWMMNESGLGVVDIFDFVGEINNEIQYPGKTPEERKKLIMAKYKERQELENI